MTEAGDKQVIYFIAAKGTPYVKIGRTRKPVEHRLAMLAVGCPLPLEIIRTVVVPVGNEADVEKKLHRKFKKYRKRGEWFVLNRIDIEKTVAEIEGGKIRGFYKTFPSYLIDQLERHHPIGDIARDSFADGDNPQMLRFTEWREYLESCNACGNAHRALVMAWAEYRHVRVPQS